MANEEDELGAMRRRRFELRSEEDGQLEEFIRSRLNDDELDRDWQTIREMAQEARSAASETGTRQKSVLGFWKRWPFWALAGPVCAALVLILWLDSLERQRPTKPPLVVVETNRLGPTKMSPKTEIVQPTTGDPSPELIEPDGLLELLPDSIRWPTTKKNPSTMAQPNTGILSETRLPKRPVLESTDSQTFGPKRFQLVLTFAEPPRRNADSYSLTTLAPIHPPIEKAIETSLGDYLKSASSLAPTNLNERILSESVPLTRLLARSVTGLMTEAPLLADSTRFRVDLDVSVIQEIYKYEDGSTKWSLSVQSEFNAWRDLQTGDAGVFTKGRFSSFSPIVYYECYRGDIGK